MKSLLRLLAVTAVFVLAAASHAADLSITASSFKTGPRAKFRAPAFAGVAITAGQAVYLDGNGKWQLADANGTGTEKVEGLAAHGALANQPLLVVYEDDDLTLGATLSMVTPIYVLSGTAGGIAPSADIASGFHPKYILTAKSTTKCILSFPRGLQFTAVATGS
jgi:hypothetical protein